jgi:phosphatidyl-myo-inositol dimannoside synthase
VVDAGSVRPAVLILTPDFPPQVGGIQTLVARIAAGLEHFRPLVVTSAASGGREFDRQQPFRVVRVPAGSGHRRRIANLNALGALEGMRRKPGVILSSHVVTGPAAIAVGCLLGRPVVQYVHAQELIHRDRLARHVLTRSDAIVAVSRYSRKLAENCGGRRDRIHIVHPGVDCAPTPPEPAFERSTIVVVGRLAERYKGHDMLLRALPLVRERLADANLHVVGDGPLRPELERLARQLGVDSATTFHGALADGQRDSLLRECSVFAMPSRLEASGAGEGFGIVYVEAGAQGLPVVAGNVGGALDAVADGETGLLVDPESPRAVADALIDLLADRERARRMGRAGWEHARARSWTRVAAEVEAVLDAVTAG